MINFSINDIPPIPRVVSEILNLKEDDKVTGAKELEKIIKLDQVLTARVLRVANSAFYAQSRKISNLSQAIAVLGVETLKSLVILIISTNYKVSKEFHSFHGTFWKHSIFTAFMSRIIAKKLKIKDPEDFFIAGLLHDFGKLIFAAMYPDKYKEVLLYQEENALASFEVEKELLGITHNEVGALAFNQWNFPEKLIKAAKYHNDPEKDEEKEKYSISRVIAYANILSKTFGYGWVTPHDLKLLSAIKRDMEISKEDIEYLENSLLAKNIEEDEFFKTCISLLGNE